MNHAPSQGSSPSERSRIISNTLVTYVAQAISGIVGLLLVPFLISRLGEEAFGVIGVANAVLEITILVDLGTRQAAARQFTHFLSRGEIDRSNELASSAMAAYVAMTFLITGFIAAAGFPLLGILNVADPLHNAGYALLLFASLSVGTSLLRSPYDAALWSQLRHDIPQLIQIVSVVLRTGILVACFMLWRPELLLWSLSALIAGLVSLELLRRQAHLRCTTLDISARLVSKRGVRDLVGFSTYTSIIRLSDWLWLSSSPLIISIFLGTAAVAHYAPAAAVISALQPLSRAFLVQLMPIVTRANNTGDQGKLARVFLESTRYSLLTNGAAAVLIASVTGPLCRVWLGYAFRDTAIVLTLLCVRELLQACVGGSFSIFVGTGRLRAISIAGLAASVLTIGLSACLVGFTQLGVVGVAIAIAGVHVFRTAVDYFLASGLCGISAREYLRDALLGPLAALTVATAVSLGIQAFLDGSPLLELLISGGASALAFAGCAWTLGLTQPDRTRLIDYARDVWSQLGPSTGGRRWK